MKLFLIDIGENVGDVSNGFTVVNESAQAGSNQVIVEENDPSKPAVWKRLENGEVEQLTVAEFEQHQTDTQQSERIALTRNSISTTAEKNRVEITGNKNSLKTTYWLEKKYRAQRHLEGTANDADVKILRAEFEARAKGGDFDDFCRRIIERSDEYSLVAGVIDGLERKYLTDVTDNYDSTKDYLNLFEAEIKEAILQTSI